LGGRGCRFDPVAKEEEEDRTGSLTHRLPTFAGTEEPGFLIGIGRAIILAGAVGGEIGTAETVGAKENSGAEGLSFVVGVGARLLSVVSEPTCATGAAVATGRFSVLPLTFRIASAFFACPLPPPAAVVRLPNFPWLLFFFTPPSPFPSAPFSAAAVDFGGLICFEDADGG